MDEPVNLTPAEVAQRLRMSLKALEMLRHRGGGPKFFRRGRSVLYRLEDIRAYEGATLQRSDENTEAKGSPVDITDSDHTPIHDINHAERLAHTQETITKILSHHNNLIGPSNGLWHCIASDCHYTVPGKDVSETSLWRHHAELIVDAGISIQ